MVRRRLVPVNFMGKGSTAPTRKMNIIVMDEPMKNPLKKLLCLAAAASLFSATALGEYTIPVLALDDARNLIAKGHTTAETLKVNVCMAIVDPSGSLITFDRMDHAPYGCIDAAIAKAKSAALFRVKTSVNMQRVNGDEPAIAKLPHMIPLGGGVPVMNNDVVVGAVGVSGATNAMEVKIAEAMVAGYGVIPEK
ncbi:heme-binding protein [uncultured Bartonella sp.]|uniref:GlcG/HbpS family heme-binding protein n=1 Tax=uncultured Bartonella sp. TaxID=104108 RepID=UPI00261AE5D7|nr:heme-binding protein [uncultured Bartonella sp.]